MMRLTIIGFGNQAKAWALNLKESGFSIRVALLPGSPSIPKAQLLNIEVVEIGSEDFYQDKAFAILTPDHTHQLFMNKYAKSFSAGSYILFAHGYSLLKYEFQKTFPNINPILFAPKSIGTELRKQYQMKGQLGAVYSTEYLKTDKNTFEEWLRILAKSLGITMGPYQTTFKNETQADLYSEQGILCSLIPYAASKMFNDLIENGIEAELAYFECWHELKLIINAMIDKGPEGFFDLISPNALIGSEKGFHKLFTPEFESNMKGLLTDIQNGKFEQEIDQTNVNQLRETIRKRWEKSPLMNTFKKINHEQV